MISNEYATKGTVRNAEFMVRKNKEEYDADFTSFKQETSVRFKTMQDDFNMRVESREVNVLKGSIELRGFRKNHIRRRWR